MMCKRYGVEESEIPECGPLDDSVWPDCPEIGYKGDPFTVRVKEEYGVWKRNY